MFDPRSSSSLEALHAPTLAECSSPISGQVEALLIARGNSGTEDTLLVNMFPGVGTMAFQAAQERWILTPSLGICQAVLLASRSEDLRGRLSLTHFAPAFLDDHVAALRELSALHLSEGYSEHHVVFAYPLQDYEGRYHPPIRTQAELHSHLRSGLGGLSEQSGVILHYSHEPFAESSRSALVGHLLDRQGEQHLKVDLFGQAPVLLW